MPITGRSAIFRCRSGRWQDAIKAVFLERVNILEEYDRVVRSPSFEMRIPSVVSLKTYVRPARNPAFTRFNLFLRDRFECQYCGADEDLTFDHVIPRSRGGRTTWDNVVTACAPCNLLEGWAAGASDRHASQASPASAHDQRAAQQRAEVSAQLSARFLGRLSLLGQRARAVERSGAMRSPHADQRRRAGGAMFLRATNPARS